MIQIEEDITVQKEEIKEDIMVYIHWTTKNWRRHYGLGTIDDRN